MISRKGLWILTVFLILVMVSLFGISAYQSKIQQEDQIILQSKCNSTLQPSRYFQGPVSPVIENKARRVLEIEYGSKDLYIFQASNTGSMRPSISDYSTLILITPEQKDIQIGDIISVKRQGKDDLLHRVINITKIDGETTYTTKGDNNAQQDKQTWKFEDINGKVVGVLY